MLSVKTDKILSLNPGDSWVPVELTLMWAAPMGKFCAPSWCQHVQRKSQLYPSQQTLLSWGTGDTPQLPTPSSGCRKPLPARRESRGRWLQAVFGEVPVLARPVQCWIKKVGGLVNLAWPAMTKWQRAFSSWSASRLGRRGRCSCMSEQWWWKCASLWSHRKPVPKRRSMALGF